MIQHHDAYRKEVLQPTYKRLRSTCIDCQYGTIIAVFCHKVGHENNKKGSKGEGEEEASPLSPDSKPQLEAPEV